MLNLDDPRSWFAIAALAVALVFTAGTADGTVRCGYYAGLGENCFADAAGSATRVFRPMAGENRRCSYFESACRVRETSDRSGRTTPAPSTGVGFPPPPRATGYRPLPRG
jgi:hypothetical protein